MLDIQSSSTDVDYATTSAFKAVVLGATATSTVQDAKFSVFIRAASKWADTYVGYPLSVQTYRETVPSYGRRRLMLSRTPLRAIAAVYDATDTGTATALLTCNGDYIVEDRCAGMLARNQGWPWSAPLQPPGTAGPFLSSMPLEAAPLPGQEFRPWLVDYVGGWSYNGLSTASANWSTVNGATDTGRTLPEDVEQAVILKAQALYAGGDELASEKLGDLETNYRSLGTDASGRLITRSEDLLRPYRRMVY